MKIYVCYNHKMVKMDGNWKQVYTCPLDYVRSVKKIGGCITITKCPRCGG